MGRSGSASAGLWDVDIDNDPAPSPEEGPPFSAHASRNLALLPYQIVGIVGAYIGSVVIIGTLLLTVGRSLRKKAQEMAAQPREMVKPMPKAFDPSPISPGSSWYSPKRLRQKKSATSSIRSGASNQMSPGMDSVVSFDNTVIEADLARRQHEMEQLYAAVMAQHDERKTSQQDVAEMQYGGSPPEYSGRNPPRLITDAPGLRHLQIPGSGPVSPSTPKSPIRAIYPPGRSIPPGPTSPTSPIKADYPNYSFPTQASSDPNLRVTRENRSPSVGSGQTGASRTRQKRLGKSLRNLKISSPIMKDDNSDGARTPLSPRFYTDPGIPPEPPTARTNDTVDSPAYPPTTPGTAKSWGQGDEQEEMDEIRELPQPNPQRPGAYNYNNEAQVATNIASTRPDPTKAANSSGALPFREMNRQYAQQQSSQAAFPLSPGSWNAAHGVPGSAGGGYLTSAGPVKTTFLEARRDRLGHAPRTGQATPYSPYMPFTPLTPVTPRLTSRAERKQREKEDRKIRGVITEEDQVADEKDLWSSGY
ncbi:hypothetical protein LTR37_009888 [Vermiconidia calcicola]|uniref:Uncharacterized protein n=1 Tax=Vermiconidia calcicola TaxID=1690605 RepID=A0ACC3N6D2_9PEZI|nr:hypothetical protein LTR37_009888 [Vermiconidia calcicola]